MDLIKLIDDGKFLSIIYIDTEIRNVYKESVKKLSSDLYTVTIISINANIINLSPSNVENPNTPGQAFSSLNELYTWLIAVLSSESGPTPPTTLTHNGEIVTHNGSPVLY